MTTADIASRMRIAGATAAVMALVLIVACGPAAAPPAPVSLLGVAGRVNEHVSAASDGGSVVALAWSGSADATGTDIFAAVSTDGGGTFTPPARVNAVDGQANVNGEQPPRVAVVREAGGSRSIVVLWTAKGEDGTVLLSARSTDGGHTFGPSAALPGVQAPGNRGWESMAAADDGRLYAVWLDHRDTARQPGADAGTHHHGDGTSAAAMDGPARAQRSQIFVSAVDGSLAPKSIARGVCYCCKTALTTGPGGSVYAAWRHVYEGNRRDIAFAASRDGGRSFDPPVRVSEDDWQIDGCPENGPALSVDGRDRIHVIWPTLVRGAAGETLRLYHASSLDGRRFTPRAALPVSGAAYHPQLVSTPDGRLIAAWDEVVGGQRQIKAARGEPKADGSVAFTPLPLAAAGRGEYPALTATATDAVMAWTQRAAGETRIAVQRLPR
jgi:hypothetical protein